MSKIQKIVLVIIFFLCMIVTTTILYNFDKNNNQYILTIDDTKVLLNEYTTYAKILKNKIEEEYIEKNGKGKVNTIWTSELYGINAEQYLKEQTLETLIRNKICDQKFNEFELEIDEEEITESVSTESVRKLINKIGITEEQYIEYLKSEEKYTTLSDYFMENVIISNKEANEYIENNNNGSIYVIKRMIFLTTDKTTLAQTYTEEEVKKIYEKAQSVLTLLQSGEKFEQLASQYSDTISSYKPGDPYVFLEGTSDNKKIEEVAKKMELGKYSEVFETPNGYEIIKLEQIVTKEDDTYLDDVKEIMLSTKKEEMFEKEYDKWYRLSDIDINNSVVNNIKIV